MESILVPCRDEEKRDKEICKSCTSKAGLCQVYRLKENPTAKASVRSGKWHQYNSQAAIQSADQITLERQFDLVHDITTDLLRDVPLIFEVTFAFKIPKTRESRRNLLVGTPHTIKPDADNCIKHLLDCAKGILYYDDSQISRIIAKKIWDIEGYTEFTIKVIN